MTMSTSLVTQPSKLPDSIVDNPKTGIQSTFQAKFYVPSINDSLWRSGTFLV